MRLWLAGAFAAVSLITAGAVYLFGDQPAALLAAVADRRPRRLPDRGRRSPTASSRLARAAGEMAAGSFDAPLERRRPRRDRRPRPRPRVDARLAEGELRRAHRRPQQAAGDLRRPHRRGHGRRLRRPGALLQQRRRAACSTPTASRRSRCCRHLQPRRRGRLRRPPGAADRRPRLRDDRPLAARRARRPRRRRATAPTRCAASWPKPTSSPTPRTSCATRWPASPARSRSCRSGAKDDPEARDHFLSRLAEDAERMNRLTQSLLTLARVESLGAGETEVVDVAGRDPRRRRRGRGADARRARRRGRARPRRRAATRRCCAR